MIKKISLILAMVSFASLASAQVFNLIPNGDFEALDDSTTWVEASGGGTVVFSYPDSGGNTGGYGSIDAGTGAWAVLVSPTEAGNIGGGVPIGDLGLTANTSVDFKIDMINLGGAGNVGGLKVEAWAGNALIGNSGDVRPTLIGDGSTWETYTITWTVPDLTEKLIFVPLWEGEAAIGYDNVGAMGAVVPEPSTIAFVFGIFALGLVAYRNRTKNKA
ncbi:MAG: hypothetical protein AB3N63_19820 [Puniceicoccaceae bacterium]